MVREHQVLKGELTELVDSGSRVLGMGGVGEEVFDIRTSVDEIHFATVADENGKSRVEDSIG